MLNFPGAYSTQAFGINDVGDIVGAMAFPGIGGDSAFVRHSGTFTTINNPASSSPGGDLVTAAADINNRGQIVGYFTDEGPYHPLVYNDGTFTGSGLPADAGNHSFALGITTVVRSWAITSVQPARTGSRDSHALTKVSS